CRRYIQMLGTHKSEKSTKYRSLKYMNRFLWLTKKRRCIVHYDTPSFLPIILIYKEQDGNQ
ncbi:MAG: hypothetical protein SOY65_10780, partial [Marinifilaceae bacterium]|nr:hypothetical protein [Marinifilaceae bacterium]